MEIARQLGTVYNALTVEAPDNKHVFYYQDGMVPYLRLKVTAHGRTWVFDTGYGGKHIKRQIGKATLIGLPEARMKAYEWRKMLEEGAVPPTLNARSASTVKKLLRVGQVFMAYYEKRLMLNAATHLEILRGFEQPYWDKIRNVQASDLTPEIVQSWLNTIAKDHGRATANKQLTSLKASLRWASSYRMITLAADLFIVVKPFPELKRSEYLHGDQVQKLSAALEQESENVRDAIWCLLLTGQRKRNVLSMEWSEIDFTGKLWTIPARKTKTKVEYNVPLTAKVLEILERRRGNHERFVFPSCRRSQRGHLTAINNAWLGVRKRAGLGRLTIHGLRHTVGTWMAQKGAQAFDIQRALNHGSITTSLRYIHAVADNARGFFEAVQEEIR